MKKRIVTLALLAALSAMASAQASEFDGGFIGARAGLNRSDISGLTAAGGKDATTFGIDGGYNWDIQSFLLGVDVFADSNSKADHGIAAAPFTTNYGSNAYGVDLKLGLPNGSWMPYARLGYSQTNGTGGSSAISGGGLHGGVGIEYKYTLNWGVNAEWSTSSAKTNGSKLNNDNLTVGIRYYFVAPKEAPAPVVEKEEPRLEPMVAPIPAPAPAPVVVPAPAPQPKESWKTILTEKPVRLEGANFATGSAKLLKTADVKLSEVVNAARQYPEVKLEVSGHTDNRGKKALNQKLSENRAAAVKAWLVKHGVAADRISTAGYADTQPIADNKTNAGRASNRRVEVRYVVKEEKKVRVTE
jgi:OmpA-OmpF porin, OOP family